MWWIIGVLSLPIAMKWAKKDIHNIKTDFKTTVVDNDEINKSNIQKHFIDICKSLNIKLDNKNRPIKKQQYILGVEFLQYKGHKDEIIDIFYELYMSLSLIDY